MTTGTRMSWATAAKWAVRERGDAVTLVETHRGVACGVIVDVQGSGEGAGTLAWSLVGLATQMASEGGSAASIASIVNRALWTRRRGRVQASVGVLIVEPSRLVTLARYGSVLTGGPGSDDEESTNAPAAGIDRDAEPSIATVRIEDHALVMCSDGVASSKDQLTRLLDGDISVDFTASELLQQAVARDNGRPRNDMSIIVVAATHLVVPSALACHGEMTLLDRSSSSARSTTDA